MLKHIFLLQHIAVMMEILNVVNVI